MTGATGPAPRGWEDRWLTAERIRLWVGALLVIYAALVAIRCLVAGGLWFLQPDGTRLPYDFLVFRAAGEMAARGEAALTYDWAPILAEVRRLMGAEQPHILPWVNPPQFLLVHAPLSRLPYAAHWFAFSLGSAALCGWAFGRALPGHRAAVLAFAAPAALLTILLGQASFLSAGLLVLALAVLPARPVLAGILIDCLSFKPNLGLVLPLLLVAGGAWRTVFAAAATVVVLVAASALAFGPETWVAYLRSAGELADFNLHDMESGALRPRWPHAQSFYNFGIAVSGSKAVAAVLHLAMVLPAVAVATLLWRGGAAPGVKAAAALAVSFLATPYVHAYDALLLAGAVAFLTREGLAQGFLPGERVMLVLSFILPAGAIFANFALFAPVAALLLLWLAARRARAGTSRPRSGVTTAEGG